MPKYLEYAFLRVSLLNSVMKTGVELLTGDREGLELILIEERLTIG